MEKERRKKEEVRMGWLVAVGLVGLVITGALGGIWPASINDYPNVGLVPTPKTHFGLTLFFICFFWGYFKFAREGDRRYITIVTVLTIAYGTLLFPNISTPAWVVIFGMILTLELFSVLPWHR